LIESIGVESKESRPANGNEEAAIAEATGSREGQGLTFGFGRREQLFGFKDEFLGSGFVALADAFRRYFQTAQRLVLVAVHDDLSRHRQLPFRGLVAVADVGLFLF